MKTYRFGLVFELAGDDLDDVVDTFFEAGCDDATFGSKNGLMHAEFDREAPSFPAALRSAIAQIESVPGVLVRRIEPDDLVTASDIAQRIGRTREGIRLLASGDRGPGGFPAPAFSLENGTRVWRWSDVAAWFAAKIGDRAYGDKYDRFIATYNAVLDLRNGMQFVVSPEERHELSRMLHRLVTQCRRTTRPKASRASA